MKGIVTAAKIADRARHRSTGANRLILGRARTTWSGYARSEMQTRYRKLAGQLERRARSGFSAALAAPGLGPDAQARHTWQTARDQLTGFDYAKRAGRTRRALAALDVVKASFPGARRTFYATGGRSTVRGILRYELLREPYKRVGAAARKLESRVVKTATAKGVEFAKTATGRRVPSGRPGRHRRGGGRDRMAPRGPPRRGVSWSRRSAGSQRPR